MVISKSTENIVLWQRCAESTAASSKMDVNKLSCPGIFALYHPSLCFPLHHASADYVRTIVMREPGTFRARVGSRNVGFWFWFGLGSKDKSQVRIKYEVF